MNVTFEKTAILHIVSKLVNLTEKRSLMPVLSNILIEFSKGEVRMYSTDLELSARGCIKQEIAIDEDKRILIHGKKFLDILKEMDDIPIELIIEDKTIHIRQKESKFTLGLIDPEDFPEIRFLHEKKGFSIKGTNLILMIDKVGFAISEDVTRNVLTGMFMKGLKDKIIVVGTDGFRMALYQKNVPNIEEFNGVIIPKRTLLELKDMVDKEDDVNIVVEDKDIQFDTGKITLVSRIIEGTYPKFEKAIPEDNPNVAVIERERLIRGLKRVSSILGRSDPVKISFYDKERRMDIETESDIGTAKDTITEIDYNGKDIMCYFNVRYVMDVITHIESDNVVIKLPNTRGAVLFEGQNLKDYKNIIMPVRI